MQPLFWFIRTLLLSGLLPWPTTGQFHVRGPRKAVIALVGEEAVLSCYLDPVMDAQGMKVMWYRSNPSGLVHRYGASQDHEAQQLPQYQGRTELLMENITKGQVTLKIHSIQPLDNGQYRCLFENSTFYNDAQFEVLVTGLGVIPRIRIEPGNTDEVKLTCTSMGWFPEPGVLWRDLQGLHLAPDSETKTIEVNGLFHVATSVIVAKSSGGAVSCLIRNPVLNVVKEVHISVADALFSRNYSIVILAVFLTLLFVAIIVLPAVYAIIRRTKDKLKVEYDKLKVEYDEINKELDQRKDIGMEGLNQARRFAEDITLDKTTAHPYLQVSEDGKSVISLSEKQNLPDNPDRFDTMVAVLGQNCFSHGDHYWEVNVENKSRWAIGLCGASVPRKGQYISARPGNNFWILSQDNGNYKALTSPRSLLHVPVSPLIVGIFLQYDKGLISFYNVNDVTLLYIFKNNFTQPLKPYFYPGPLNERNHNGLHILKVSATDPGLHTENTADLP